MLFPLGKYSMGAPESNEDYRHLYPKYVSSYQVFVCPSTSNIIRPLVSSGTGSYQGKPDDLGRMSGGATAVAGGHSYEAFPNIHRCNLAGNKYPVRKIRTRC